LVQRTEGAASAERFLLQRLQQQPSLSGVQELLRLRGPAEHAADPVPGLLDALSRTRPRYRCDSCGFAGNKLYWQCPSCQSWSTVKPLKGHELV
ncbi:MAG: lipopolysaccharide assembly protein LapB, partial [Pseudomonadota bacterium]|nr:lipopolysaccharide assembly protein LapB [Pseudomonadota bacterium]